MASASLLCRGVRATTRQHVTRGRTNVPAGLGAALPIRMFSASASFEFKNQFKLHKLDVGPENQCTSTKEEMMGFYKEMVYWRRLEIVADTLYKQRLIRGFCHLYDGQEAIAAGMEAALTKKDGIITAYRDHVQQMARGDTGERVVAELLGKATGCSKGKGGSMHMYLPENNFYGGNGIVGAQIPVGAGVAYAMKYRGQENVCVAMMGDGAANQGQVYEAANMAALWKLPVIFCIENNTFGMGTSSDRAAANPNFYERGGYVPGVWMDGMDVLAVKTGFQWAKKWVVENGPLFVELQTYRYHGHSMSDPGVSYRSRDEVQRVRAERDCIEGVKARLLDNGWATQEELKVIDKEARKAVDKASEFAKNSPDPADQELYTEIYTDAPPPFIRAVEYEDSQGDLLL